MLKPIIDLLVRGHLAQSDSSKTFNWIELWDIEKNTITGSTFVTVYDVVSQMIKCRRGNKLTEIVDNKSYVRISIGEINEATNDL